MNKARLDDEFARIHMSYFMADGREVAVYCLESGNTRSTQDPYRRALHLSLQSAAPDPESIIKEEVAQAKPIETTPFAELMEVTAQAPKEQHYTIFYSSAGNRYESIFGPYLRGVKSVEIVDPYILLTHQIQNFVCFCELVFKYPSIKRIKLITSNNEINNQAQMQDKLNELKQGLHEMDFVLDICINQNMHDREVRLGLRRLSHF